MSRQDTSRSVVLDACQSAYGDTASAAATISALSSAGKRFAWQGWKGSARDSIDSKSARVRSMGVVPTTSFNAEREFVITSPRVRSGYRCA